MRVNFNKVSDFNRGILRELLSDAYSFDCSIEKEYGCDWQAFDDFFYNNPDIADKCGFITVLNNKAIGFVSWNPTMMPEYVEIGHNCIAAKYKCNGYGKLQLQEAMNRIIKHDVKKIIVTTSEILVPAQKMYESAGFVFLQKRAKKSVFGDDIDYAYYFEPQL